MKTNRRRLLQSAGVASAAIGAGRFIGTLPAGAQEAGAIDELRIAMAALPPQLDPATTTWIVMQRVYPLIFDKLIERDWANPGQLVPALATEWEQVDDTTLTMTLREGVVFADGSPFTANDVKFTFDRTLEGNAELGATGQFPFSEIIVDDDLHVTFKTDGPRGGILTKLTGNEANIVPQAYFEEVGYEKFQQAPIGTGPFKLVENVQDQYQRFEVNENYWGGVSPAKSVRIVPIPEVSTRIAALLNNEIDLMLDVPPDQVSTVTGGGDFGVTSVTPLNINIYQMVGIAPTDNKSIRQAMNMGFDRGAIVDGLLGGYGVWTTGMQSPYDPLYTERPQLPYDPEQAKELLAAAGYDGAEIKLTFDSPNYYPLEQEWTQAIVSMWTDLGLNVSMAPIDVNQRVLITPEDGWNLFTDSQDVTTDTLKITFGSPEAWCQAQFPNEPAGTFDQLNATVEQFEATVDEAERKELAKQAYDFIEDFVMVIPIMTIQRIAAAQPGIAFQETPMFGIDLRPANFSIAS